MKYILFKKSWLPISCLVVGGALLLGSCTKKFEEYNTNPYGITNADLSADYRLLGEPLKSAQLNIYIASPAWATQLQQNLIGDVYSGYMAPPTPFANNVNNMTYSLVDGWNGVPWDFTYSNIMVPTKRVLEQAGTKYPDFYAWAKILRVEAMHRVSDIYGPIIYTKYGKINSDGSVSYDSQKDAYYAFFADLDSAINTLTPLAQSGAPKTFTNFDLAYGGDFGEWVKFANTLRLRLALRIVKADPAKAQTEGQKALANPLGLLSTNNDNFNISIGTTVHPLNTISNSWGDIRMGAPMESILSGYGDPRIGKYFLTASDPVVAGQYKGIRCGINIDAKGRYANFSPLVIFPGQEQLMTAAEAWFLKAEAAIRGWTGAGDAKTAYQNGVLASFSQYGMDGTAYLNDGTSKARPYTDPKALTPGQNDVLTGSPFLSTITIKWDPLATMDQQLERIITQKWIAMYPDGQEAWSEFRRTGYPKLFPVVVNNSGGTISTNTFIRRINFAQSERSTNPAGVQGAVGLLGGADNGGTRLWWDKP